MQRLRTSLAAAAAQNSRLESDLRYSNPPAPSQLPALWLPDLSVLVFVFPINRVHFVLLSGCCRTAGRRAEIAEAARGAAEAARAEAAALQEQLLQEQDTLNQLLTKVEWTRGGQSER